MSEARPGVTPHRVRLLAGRTRRQSLLPVEAGWEGRLPVIGELMSAELISYQGNQ